jgi:alpha-1,2-rhamnosyltransferase
MRGVPFVKAMEDAMNEAMKIDLYLAKQAHLEELEQRREKADALTRFVTVKMKELYWSVTRLAGLAHWHDGSRSMRSVTRAPIACALVEDGAIRATTRRPRVLIDMTATLRTGLETGIQRVVREIGRRAIESGEGLPVFIEDGRLVSYYDHPGLPDTVEIIDGDKLLMLDAGWAHTDELAAVMKMVSARGGETIVGLYDIIPLLHPDAVGPGAFLAFQNWFERIVLKADAVVCISESTARSFVEHVEQFDPTGRQRRIGWFRLGADFDPGPRAPVSSRAAALAASRTPFFLSVGSLEPRKGYGVALDAFETLWSQGVEARYVIVGRRGWRSSALERRIRRHAEHGRRLFWLDDADDATLRALYRRATSLVFPSCLEGFGLPLAEAAYRRLPVIASDIPVFREIAGDHARFFALLDADDLAEHIRRALEGERPNGSAPVCTWRESMQTLLGMIRADAYQWRLSRVRAHSSPMETRRDYRDEFYGAAS